MQSVKQLHKEPREQREEQEQKDKLQGYYEMSDGEKGLANVVVNVTPQKQGLLRDTT